MKKIKFYKTEEGQWYIDLPYYLTMGGHISHLLMVAGADILLDLIDMDESGVVYLMVSDASNAVMWTGNPAWEEEALYKVSEPINISMGCTYRLSLFSEYWEKMYTNDNPHGTVWLCPTTLYVFDNIYPDKIYFRKITKEEYEQGENAIK